MDGQRGRQIAIQTGTQELTGVYDAWNPEPVGRYGKEFDIEPGFLRRLACSVVTIPPELSWLLFMSRRREESVKRR